MTTKTLADKIYEADEAKSRLEKTAPAMLDMLKLVARDFRDSKDKYMPRPFGQDEMLEQIEEIIAKATGETA